MYTFCFPLGTTLHRVPRREFYAVTAAFGALDLDRERAGPAPLMPVFVGGTVMGNRLIDLR